MTNNEDDTFCKKMRKATREIHAVSDALVNAKLAVGFSDDNVWADGLLVFYEIFRYLEGAMIRLKSTKVGQLKIAGMERTEAFEKDLKYYLGNDWMKDYSPRESVIKYLMRLREVEDTDPTLLMAYIYHLYMGLLSGGIILRKKRQLARRMSIFKGAEDESTIDGQCVTDFGDLNIYQLKQEMRERMNKIASDLDENTQKKLIDESKIVYSMNNLIIRSVQGAGSVVVKKILYIASVAVFIVIVVSALLKQ